MILSLSTFSFSQKNSHTNTTYCTNRNESVDNTDSITLITKVTTRLQAELFVHNESRAKVGEWLNAITNKKSKF